MIRDLLPTDLEWMASVERDLFGASAWSKELITHDFHYGFTRYRGIEADGALAGYAVYGFDGDAFHLMNIAVVPQARRRGLARALIEDFLREAHDVGAADVWLEVAVTNAAALALYADYGFEQVRVRRKYYQPEGVDAVVMRKELRGFAPVVV